MAPCLTRWEKFFGKVTSDWSKNCLSRHSGICRNLKSGRMVNNLWEWEQRIQLWLPMGDMHRQRLQEWKGSTSSPSSSQPVTTHKNAGGVTSKSSTYLITSKNGLQFEITKRIFTSPTFVFIGAIRNSKWCVLFGISTAGCKLWLMSERWKKYMQHPTLNLISFRETISPTRIVS